LDHVRLGFDAFCLATALIGAKIFSFETIPGHSV